MPRAYLVILVLVLSAAAVACTSVEAPPTYDEGFRVQGVGIVQAQPDIALLSLGVEAHAPTADAARTQAAETMTRLLASLRGNGVKPEDIQTEQFVLRYGYGRACESSTLAAQPSPFAPPVALAPDTPLEACFLSRVQVKIRDLAKADAVMDGAIAAGAPVVAISAFRYTVEKPEAAVEEARQKALADAKKKAESQAKVLGVTLGKVKSVNTSVQLPAFGYEFSFGRAISAPATGGGGYYGPLEIPVQAGLSDIVVTAFVQFETK